MHMCGGGGGIAPPATGYTSDFLPTHPLADGALPLIADRPPLLYFSTLP
jgi:hypothetical protein